MPGPNEALFSAVRGIPAADAAEKLNIQLKRQGNRAVALCPFHNEKTPSLNFFPGGRFYCFGCQEHGGAIELYQKILKVSALEAARALAADFNIIQTERDAPVPRRGPTAMDLKRALDAFKDELWDSLCFKKRILLIKRRTIEHLLKTMEKCAESDELNSVINDISRVDIMLYQLEDANPAELLLMSGGTNEQK